MFPFLNMYLEEFLLQRLHQEKEAMVANALETFRTRYPNAAPAHLEPLRERLEAEIIRVYPIVERSVMRATLRREMWRFWQYVLVGTFVMVCGGKVPPEHWLDFFVPSIMAFSNLVNAYITIHIPFNERVEGGMNATIATYAHQNGLNPAASNSSGYMLQEFAALAPPPVLPRRVPSPPSDSAHAPLLTSVDSLDLESQQPVPSGNTASSIDFAA